ncbi:hypothetical protein [Glycomyces harbinensis]|uniref:hypothetical protein n=1 Tax=Glycomyces harbinensis TaxID=58114 RepID=UPI003B00389E
MKSAATETAKIAAAHVEDDDYEDEYDEDVEFADETASEAGDSGIVVETETTDLAAATEEAVPADADQVLAENETADEADAETDGGDTASGKATA